MNSNDYYNSNKEKFNPKPVLSVSERRNQQIDLFQALGITRTNNGIVSSLGAD